VTDFGIARAITAAATQTALTEVGFAVGTPAYMSPEQVAGELSLDGRSDVYALGCVLYEMLAGHPPFTGPSAQAVAARHLNDPPPSVRAVRPGYDPISWTGELSWFAFTPTQGFFV
jgi:serine/threonine-protein kinase